MNESKERIAFELMQMIANEDVQSTNERSKDPKAYFLGLYKECFDVVTGNEPFKKAE